MQSMIRYIFLITFLVFACTSTKEKKENIPPSLLFIMVDDLRPELGAYGAKHIHSPHIDQLASESILFERAYCNIPVCGSSRASLLAGVRPGWYRFHGPYDTYLSHDMPHVVSLPKHFRNNGYQTFSYGKIFHHANDDSLAWNEIWKPKPKNHSGWRDYQTEENLELHQSATSRGLPYEKAVLPDTAYYDGRIATHTIDKLKELSKSEKPFFLATGFLKPHLPFNAPARYWDLYDSTAIELPENYLQPGTTPKNAFHNFGELRNYASIPKKGSLSEAQAQKLIHGYYACVSYTDAQIGKVLAALEQTGLAENTIVVLIGDHGWNLGNHQLWCKHCNFETSLRTPLIVKVPGQTHGQKNKSIVEFIDVYPTLTELAGISSPKHLQGESLAKLLYNEPRKKDYAISKFFGGVTLIKDNWFYTEWINEKAEVQASMLFDHATDSLELVNLAEKEEYQDKTNELNKFLHTHWGDNFFTDNSIQSGN